METSTISNVQTVIPQDSYVRHIPSQRIGQEEHKQEQVTIPGNSKKDDERQLDKAIDKINKSIESMDTSLHFFKDKGSGRIAVKVINNKTQEVVREIPSEEVLRLAADMKDIAGLIIDKSI
jgi:flagellar protein FlaG